MIAPVPQPMSDDEEWPDTIKVGDALLILVVRRADGGDPDNAVGDVELDTDITSRIAPGDAAVALWRAAQRCAAQQLVLDRSN